MYLHEDRGHGVAQLVRGDRYEGIRARIAWRNSSSVRADAPVGSAMALFQSSKALPLHKPLARSKLPLT